MDRVELAKMELCGETIMASSTLTILEDFCWFVSVCGHKLPGVAEFPEKITTVAGVIEVITHLDACVICAGNPDDKYECLLEDRKGVFMDSSGTYIPLT